MSQPAKHEKAVFLAALEKHTLRERLAFLENACTGDPDLMERVKELLATHQESRGPLDSPPPGVDATIDQPITEKPGTVIDRYKLLEQIGEGDFGVVFMAEQEEPVRRKVALKIIKPGMDTKEVIARFEAERQALAIMDHPNIARVLDGGATESGRPYFVMELVRGIPITDFCDQNSLTARERLELFASVCQAVQHAHQKGIIHRDIKPSNVMVTLRDDTPVAKVIDFGVAKATNARLTDRTLFTRFGQMIGTPLYMSPEQAGMSELDVDTRSDIYSLGVLLYELLTGATPFDQQRIREAAYDELLKIIREEEPPKPSLRISTLGDTLPSVAAQRKLEPKKLSALVRGELDWIVMKALEKDRMRRYETATSFAADIQRYLKDQPVEACPPSAVYRFRKFARRNKATLATAALVAAALLVGLVGTTWQAVRAMRSEKAAEAERNVAQQERRRAEANFQKALEAVDQMLTRVGNERLADVPQMEQVRRELLEDALKFHQRFLQEKSADPAVQQETGNAYHRVGRIRGMLGQHEEAEKAYRQAVALFEKVPDGFRGERLLRTDLAGTLNNLAALLWETGRSEEAEEVCRRALAIREQLAADSPDVPECQADLGAALNNLSVFLLRANQHKEAEGAIRRAVAIREQLAADFPDVQDYRNHLAQSHNNLGNVLDKSGRPEEAEQASRQALAIQKALATKFPNVPEYRHELAKFHLNLGKLLVENGRTPEAEQPIREALDLQEKLVADFPDVPDYRDGLAGSHNTLGVVLKESGRSEEAEQAYRQGLATQMALATTFPNVPQYRHELAIFHYNLGIQLRNAGRTQEAEQQYAAALDLQEKLVADFPGVPEYQAHLVDIYHNLSKLLRETDRLKDAEKAYYRRADVCQKLVDEFPDVAEYGDRLAKCYVGLQLLGWAHYGAGDWQASLEALEQSCALQPNGVGDPNQWFFLAMAHWQLGNKDEARRWYVQSIAWMRQKNSTNEELLQFRDEAEQLLGLPAGAETVARDGE